MGAVLISSAAFAGNIRLSLPQNAEAAVELALPEGLTDEPSKVLQVFVGTGEKCCDTRTRIAGQYSHENNVLRFIPAFGFSAGQNYVARVHEAEDEELIPFHIPVEAAKTPAAVTEIYPSGDTLPENTLRFYIHFTVPMQPRVAFDYIKLRNASGEVDEATFMRFKQELWNEDRTRLTVLVDPGRIKREVATNVELGPALLSGQQYTLTIESGWSSADGTSALSTFTKTFRVSNALRTRPDTNLWTSNAPCAGTREPLNINLDRPFDRSLLTRALRVETVTGDEVEGVSQVKGAEYIWSYTPMKPWPAKDMLLIANPTLEDVAGNNFRDLLDHVASLQASDMAASELPIRIRSCAD